MTRQPDAQKEQRSIYLLLFKFSHPYFTAKNLKNAKWPRWITIFYLFYTFNLLLFDQTTPYIKEIMKWFNNRYVFEPV